MLENLLKQVQVVKHHIGRLTTSLLVPVHTTYNKDALDMQVSTRSVYVSTQWDEM